MFRKIALLNLSLLVLVMGLLGCGSESPTATAVPATNVPATVQPTSTKVATQAPTVAPTSAPTSAPTIAPTTVPMTAAPTNTPTAQQPTAAPSTLTAEPTAASSGGASTSFDGRWKGESNNSVGGKNNPMGFTVSNNEISFMFVNFFIDSGACKGFSGAFGQDVQDAPIQNNAVAAQFQDEDVKIELKGTFESATQASGTFRATGKSSFCGDYELETEWSATREAASTGAFPTQESGTSTTGGLEALPTGVATGNEDACAVFLQADVEEYLGKKVDFTPTDPSGWRVGGGKVSTCDYVVVDSILERSGLVFRDMDSPEDAKTYHDGFVQEIEKGGIKAEAVSGVGDQAHWLPILELLIARSGKYVLLVSMSGQTESDAKLESFVNELLERLP